MASLVERVDFEHIEAERDPNLLNYFVETDSFNRIFEGRKMYVIGRKGTGKSTIYSAIENLKHRQIKAAGLTFDDYPWNLHKRIKDETKSTDATHTGTWRYIILIELAKLLLREKQDPSAQPAELRSIATFVEAAYGTTQPKFKDLLSTILDRLRNVKRIALPRFDATGIGVGSIEFEESKPKEKAILDTVKAASDAIQDVILQLLSQGFYFVLFDKLDDGWDNSHDFKSCMIGLLRASRELNIEANKKGKLLRCVVFLRSDIYDCLLYNDKNKAFPDIEDLRWNERNLQELINKRIATSLQMQGKNKASAWLRLFERNPMRQRAPNFTYLLKRTLLRPRDLIAFCQECKNRALRNNHSKIMNKDIYKAEERYSEYVYREFLDEMHKQYPFIDKLFEVLRRIGVERFGVSRFDEEFGTSGVANMDSREALKILFDFSVIGTTRIGGRRGGSTLEFKYTDPLIQPNFAKEMVVHPSLKKHLKLREKRVRR